MDKISKLEKFQQSLEGFEQKREKFGADMEKLRTELDKKVGELFEALLETTNKEVAKTDEVIDGSIREFKTLSSSLREIESFLQEFRNSRARMLAS